MQDQDRYKISSIEKALDVIEALAEHDHLSLIELSSILGKNKSSVYRILLTLEGRGFVSRHHENGKYCLGFKQLIISKRLLENNSLRVCALPEMKRLSDKYGDTVNLGVLNEGVVLYIDIIEGTNSLRMNESVGSTGPFHATAIGKVIVSHLPKEERERLLQSTIYEPITDTTITNAAALKDELNAIRSRGYAIDNEEIVVGARCVSAPIFNNTGKVEGAISISGAAHRYPLDGMEAIAKDVRQVAEVISHKLGFYR